MPKGDALGPFVTSQSTRCSGSTSQGGTGWRPSEFNLLVPASRDTPVLLMNTFRQRLFGIPAVDACTFERLLDPTELTAGELNRPDFPGGSIS